MRRGSPAILECLIGHGDASFMMLRHEVYVEAVELVAAGLAERAHFRRAEHASHRGMLSVLDGWQDAAEPAPPPLVEDAIVAALRGEHQSGNRAQAVIGRPTGGEAGKLDALSMCSAMWRMKLWS